MTLRILSGVAAVALYATVIGTVAAALRAGMFWAGFAMGTAFILTVLAIASLVIVAVRIR